MKWERIISIAILNQSRAYVSLIGLLMGWARNRGSCSAPDNNDSTVEKIHGNHLIQLGCV